MAEICKGQRGEAHLANISKVEFVRDRCCFHVDKERRAE